MSKAFFPVFGKCIAYRRRFPLFLACVTNTGGVFPVLGKCNAYRRRFLLFFVSVAPPVGVFLCFWNLGNSKFDISESGGKRLLHRNFHDADSSETIHLLRSQSVGFVEILLPGCRCFACERLPFVAFYFWRFRVLATL